MWFLQRMLPSSSTEKILNETMLQKADRQPGHRQRREKLETL